MRTSLSHVYDRLGRLATGGISLLPSLVLSYAAAWTLGYAAVIGWPYDGSYYFEYLRLAWTFTGFEKPAFAWLISLVLFVPLAALFVFIQRTLLRSIAASREQQREHRRRYSQ